MSDFAGPAGAIRGARSRRVLPNERTAERVQHDRAEAVKQLRLADSDGAAATSPPTARADLPQLDLCAHNSTLCGLEAGCHNVNGTFVCLCTSDLKPKRPHEPCSKAPVGK
ncbi:hypothetical protein MRX96_024985 [Rhipicephalus microplus]